MAAIDVSAVVALIAQHAIPVGLVSTAVLLVSVGIRAFQWLRAALGVDGGMDPSHRDLYDHMDPLP